MAFNSQWKRSRNKHTCPAFSIMVCMSGCSFRKSSCRERTLDMQHHSSIVMDGTSPSVSAMSSAEITSSWPIASANATRRSASFCTCDFVHEAHLPMILTLRALQINVYLPYMDLRSCKMTFTPFGCPQSFGSLWSSGKYIFCCCLRVSSSPGAGPGLLRGIVVSCSFFCFPPGLMFMLFTLSESSA